MADNTTVLRGSDTRWLNTGAYVLYQIYEYPSVGEARRAFRDFAPTGSPGKYGRRTITTMKAGDEARTATETVIDDRGEPVSFRRRLDVRYGIYLLAVSASADMKTFGPRPPSGRRPWLCEPVYDQVVKAALKRMDALKQERRAPR